MVNTAFASNLQPHVNWQANAVFTIFALDLLLSLHFFAPYLHRVNLCKSNFSCSDIAKENSEKHITGPGQCKFLTQGIPDAKLPFDHVIFSLY